MVKQIAIITHSLRYNYGGILQNFALQVVLRKLGYLPITIKVYRKQSIQVKLFDWIKYVVKILLRRRANKPLSSSQLDKICKNTDVFIKEKINMSPSMWTIDKKWVYRQSFDGFIVGSDQVLHPDSYSHIEDVYLGFIENSHKIMYAASFGSSDWKYSKKQTKKCKLLIKQFKAVSVRENSAISLINHNFNVESKIVLDPTLLLRPSDYTNSSITTGGGVVTYFLDPNREKDKIANEVSVNLKAKIHIAGNPFMDDSSSCINNRIAPSVESWLNLFAKADYIITDSYHGTLFAIIFNKPFMTIANSKRGLDRFKTILSLLKLESRMIFNSEQAMDLERYIDYREVNKILEIERKQSLVFLKENLP